MMPGPLGDLSRNERRPEGLGHVNAVPEVVDAGGPDGGLVVSQARLGLYLGKHHRLETVAPELRGHCFYVERVAVPDGYLQYVVSHGAHVADYPSVLVPEWGGVVQGADTVLHRRSLRGQVGQSYHSRSFTKNCWRPRRRPRHWYVGAELEVCDCPGLAWLGRGIGTVAGVVVVDGVVGIGGGDEAEPNFLLVVHGPHAACPGRGLVTVYVDEGVVAVGVLSEGVVVGGIGDPTARAGIVGLAGIVLGVDGGPLGLNLVDFVVQDSLVGGALGLVVSEDVYEGFVSVYGRGRKSSSP